MTSLRNQQLPSEREIGENNDISRVTFSSRFLSVQSGLEFILSHLSGSQFPRTIMTAISKGQKEVSYKDTAILHYQGALWQDCRISAFYIEQTNPDLIFIDLDAKDFKNERVLKATLSKILRRIKEKIGGHPSVLWSGRGYHIIQPIDCPTDLDTIKEFADLVIDKDVNKAFLQFGAYYLSGGKKDSCNRTSLKSCLLRVPNSLNSKCIVEGKDAEVKIIQEWNGVRPSFKLFLGSFYAGLVAQKVEREKEHKKYSQCTSTFETGNGVIHWIEQLLQTPIEDNRRNMRNLVIVPYLVLRKGMTDINQIESIVMHWADRCAELRPLGSRYEFAKEVRSRVYEVARNKISQMSWARMQEEYPEIARKLGGGGN